MSRSIGDAYLKKPEFSIDPSVQRFRLSEPLRRPVLTAEPSIYARVLRPQDKFLIFASDGLWEHLTNQEAAEIVYNYPRAVCCSLFILLVLISYHVLFLAAFLCFLLVGNCKEAGQSSTAGSCSEERNEVRGSKESGKGNPPLFP